MEFVCLLFGAGIVVIVVAVLIQNHQNQLWLNAADQLGLSFEKPGFLKREISGEKLGMRVLVTTISVKEKPGGKDVTYTSYHIGFRQPLGVDVNIIPQEGRSGPMDIVVGDPVFDPKCLITGRDENAVREFLHADRRRLLLHLFKDQDDFEVTPRGIHIARRGNPVSTAMIVKTVELLVNAGDRLKELEAEERQEAEKISPPPLPEKAGDGVEEVEIAPAKIAEPSIEEAEIATASVAELIEIAENAVNSASVSEPVEVKPLEVRGLPEENDLAREETSRVVVKAEPNEPESVVVAEPELEPEAEPEPEIVSLDDAFTLLCSDLFEEGRSRFEIGRAFDAQLKGTERGGYGKLKRVDKFTNDLVFGRGPGFIAQVEVDILEGPASPVIALVELPEEGTDIGALREQIGETFAFSGKLVKCDVFNRRVFVAD